MRNLSGFYESIIGNAYLRFLLITAASIVVALLAKFIVKGVLKPLAKKTKTKIDDLIIKSISSIVFFLILVLGIKIGMQSLPVQTDLYLSLANTLLIIMITIALFRIIHNISKHWIEDWAEKTASSADDRLIPLLEKILKAVVIILAVIFIFDSWNIDISPLLATAGIAGIAIGFAVRDSLANIMGGIQLVLDKTFKVGDKVQLESGETGEILDIGLRSTKLRTYDNELIYIPNGQLANARVKNFTVPDVSIRVNVNFGVEYGSEPEKVRQVVLEAIKKVDKVQEVPEPVVQFLKMSDFSLDFVARVWIENYSDAYATQLAVTDVVYRALNEANISIPFPTRTVYTKSTD
ncbi:MAG: mechanosensitive ion channel family protein [Candidatus Aminicenantes bacterium]|nr:mechanosensitive ion channel family protein [Candidatus Aminicenantes bacterium]